MPTIIASPTHHRHATVLRPIGYGGIYPEIPARIDAIRVALVSAELGPIEEPNDFGTAPIAAVHHADLIDFLRCAWEVGGNSDRPDHPLLPDTFGAGRARTASDAINGLQGRFAFDISAPIYPGTWAAAYTAAQCALTAADRVRSGTSVAYALCRPPGHHAGSSFYGGFCYLNNAACAARALQRHAMDRVAVLDIDYHHGNGTQECFYEDASVLFVSIHADPRFDYPYFWGSREEIGSGPGLGATINHPLPPGCTETEYLKTLAVALRSISDFSPSALVVSVGFDLMKGDPVPQQGGFSIGLNGLQAIAEEIACLRLPTVLVQEGGYNLPELGLFATTFLTPFRRV